MYSESWHVNGGGIDMVMGDQQRQGRKSRACMRVWYQPETH